MPRRARDRGTRVLRAAAAAVVTSTLTAAAPVTAGVTIKLATLAPQGSVWDTTMREMGAHWSEESGGEVRLRVYPGGVAGDEADVVRKMRIGQFQGAALTVTGLSEIEPAFSVFSIPMLFASWAELDHVLGRLQPELERRLAERGFRLLFWGHGGWVHLFSREPIRTLDDLKRQKLFVWAGDDEQVRSWRSSGFQPVPLAATDVTMGFQTKMIDVVPTTPIAALTLQWYRQTPYMQAMGLAPLVGAVVVQSAAWEKVAAPLQLRLQAAADAAGERLVEEIPQQDAAAIEQMKERGLTVVDVSEDARPGWRQAAEDFSRETREGSVPPEILAAARRAIEEFRSTERAP